MAFNLEKAKVIKTNFRGASQDRTGWGTKLLPPAVSFKDTSIYARYFKKEKDQCSGGSAEAQCGVGLEGQDPCSRGGQS